jgi:type IV secretory pathway VirB2 component (pilin)
MRRGSAYYPRNKGGQKNDVTVAIFILFKMFLFSIKFYFKECFMKNSQMKVMFLFLLLAMAMPLFAADVPKALESVSTQVEEVFRSPFVTVILVCCLAGCGIAYAFNKDNEKMKRNIIAIAIGIVIVAGAKEIVGAVFKAAGP